ncbi:MULTISPECIES: metal ABC transporter substrate-binding protein [Enterococcus]|uniref:metal ABC transporter substrate-binding protein n=1 Tax=Enterococcus TaxID=1350 RepID=UPI00065E38DF|nr:MULTISPECIES: metal ABC transporter substrate-binding protein [Enterococcus]KAF1301600.1 zinc ABC transporter substrate-binding protein [Enterococcus sp. JM9B]
MKKYLVGLGLLLSGFALTACGTAENGQTAEKGQLQAIATFYPMYEFTKEVIGDEGTVELLIPAGTEPHDYEPSAKDVAKISQADAFVYNSEEMETWVESIEDSLDEEKTLVIEAADQIDLLEMTDDGHDHDHEEEDHDHDHDKDPHVWTDPIMAIKEVETIRDELSEKFPDKKAAFEKNAAAYIEKLQKLDQDFTDAFANATNKTFVTQHAAFGYLANQYGLTQESIAGISPDQEPSPSRLAELKHFVEDHGVKVIYFEENASSKVAETLSKETGVKLAVLNPVESLTKQQMEDGKTYLSIMQENLEALKESIN